MTSTEILPGTARIKSEYVADESQAERKADLTFLGTSSPILLAHYQTMTLQKGAPVIYLTGKMVLGI